TGLRGQLDPGCRHGRRALGLFLSCPPFELARDRDELLGLDERGIDQGLQGALYGAAAESVEDASHRIRRRAVRGLPGAVDERARLYGVRDVAFFFEASQ